MLDARVLKLPGGRVCYTPPRICIARERQEGGIVVGELWVWGSRGFGRGMVRWKFVGDTVIWEMLVWDCNCA